MESAMIELETKDDIDMKSDDERSTTNLEIPEDTKKCVLVKSIFDGERPSTVFFQYNHEVTGLKKKIDNNTRICAKNELDWNIKKHRNFCVMYKAYKNIPDCILIPMKTNGIVRTKSFINANLIWKLMKVDKMSVLIRKLNKHQRYNHFPCTWQIGRKDNLWKNYKIMWIQFPEDYDFIPHTFILPEDQEEMLKEVKSKPEEMWMIKPVASSRGRGIRLMTNIDSVPKRCLLSRYIQDPQLINNKKYDLRLYIVITGFQPLKIYLYEEGLVRFASEEYNMDDSNKHNRYMHLTNYSVNKCSTLFDSNISTNDECTGSKWSLNALRNYFKENNMDFAPTWGKIKDIVCKSVISIADDTIATTKKLTRHKHNLFELYGFDILIDSDLRPWLLEVNLNPSLNSESDLDIKVKSALMTDIYTLVGIVPYARGKEPVSGTGVAATRRKEPKSLHEVLKKNIKTQEEDDTMTTITSKTDDSEEDVTQETITYAMDEFSRQGMFQRVFPLKENIDYYSQFIKQPGEENIALWNWLKNTPKDSDILSSVVFGQNFDL
jgi:tubulin polyglutamylase TTLL4